MKWQIAETREASIDDFGMAGIGDENVSRLDIAVNDPLLMQVGEGAETFDYLVRRSVSAYKADRRTHSVDPIQCRRKILHQIVPERAVLEERADKTKCGVGFQDAGELQDVGMIEPVPDFCFFASMLEVLSAPMEYNLVQLHSPADAF